jgi:hypothetical protein
MPSPFTPLPSTDVVTLLTLFVIGVVLFKLVNRPPRA